MVSSWDQKTGFTCHVSVLDAKTGQDRVQEAFKTAQDEPKTLQEAFKSRKNRQNEPKMIPQALPS